MNYTRFINFKIALLVVFILAFMFRVIKISSYPQSLSMDEVTFGYAANSILKTGMDEYGRVSPLFFQGMGDFKPPVDVYLKLPFIYLFGLTEFAVRMPGVLLGSLTTVLLTLFLGELGLSKKASVFGGLWLSVSPWHIVYSRAGYEAITGLFFVMSGLLSFFLYLRTRGTAKLAGTIVSFGLAVWSYHAERVYVPLLGLFLLWFFRNHLQFRFLPKKNAVFLVALLLLFAVPFIYLTLATPGVRSRAEELWITHDPSVFHQMQDKNDVLVIGKHMVGQYLAYFDLQFIFWKGLLLTPSYYPGIGMVYLIDMPLLFAGLYFLIKNHKSKTSQITFALLLLGVIPGAFARGDPSSIRALLWVPAFGLIIANGFTLLSSKYKNKLLYYFYLMLLIVNIGFFIYIYTLGFSKYYADLWHYGYKEVTRFACSHWQDYSRIIITDKYGIEIPRIKTIPHYYLLFHCQYDPHEYLSDPGLYNVEFRQPQWFYDSKLDNALLIGSPWDFPETMPDELIKQKIYFPDGKEAFYFVETGSK